MEMKQDLAAQGSTRASKIIVLGAEETEQVPKVMANRGLAATRLRRACVRADVGTRELNQANYGPA